MAAFLSTEGYRFENFSHTCLYWKPDPFYTASSSRAALGTKHTDVLKVI